MKRIKYKIESFLKESFKLIMLIMSISVGLFFLLVNFDEKNIQIKREILIESEKSILASEIEVLEENIILIKNDLNFLAFTSSYFHNSNEDKVKLSKLWSEFSKIKNWYDQIRLIGFDGMEIIRINLVENEGIIVSEELLQNKSQRDYFQESLKLKEEDTYISKFNLNIENMKIERPFKPVIRFAKKVSDNEGKPYGVLVLNYLGKKIIEDFERIARESDGKIYLLNNEGYWLYGGTKEDEWSFMFTESQGESFGEKYNDEWEKILEGNDEFITSNGYFLVRWHQIGNEKLKIIFHVSKKDKNGYLFFESKKDKYERIIYENISIFVVLIVILILLESILSFYFGYKKVKIRADIDLLTGVFTRRAGLDRLKKIFRKKENFSKDLSIIFVDINNLKKVNDAFGHKAGDELIQKTVKIIKEVIRGEDFIFRYGGDEFVIVLLGANKGSAEKIWSRVEEKFNLENMNNLVKYELSASHGIIYIQINEKLKVSDILKHADKSMYIDKNRNKKSRS